MKSCVGANFKDIYIDNFSDAGGRLDIFCFNCARDHDVLKLLEWVIMKNVLLSELDDPLMRAFVNIIAVSSKYLSKYILSIVPIVGYEIMKELPSKFGVMFDGWYDSTIQYVGMFCFYIN